MQYDASESLKFPQ